MSIDSKHIFRQLAQVLFFVRAVSLFLRQCKIESLISLEVNHFRFKSVKREVKSGDKTERAFCRSFFYGLCFTFAVCCREAVSQHNGFVICHN